VRRDHGPLGALYPPRTWTAPNPHSALKEGDTPSWFFFLANGLNEPAHPEWGGWGGRFTNSLVNVSGASRHQGVFRDGIDTVGGVSEARASVWRWRRAFQNEFQARLDWCVTSDFQKANHLPLAVLNGDRSRDVLRLTARSGETVKLSAADSSDPDGNRLSANWSIYPEAGTYRGEVKMTATNGLGTSFTAPSVPTAATIHVILEVRDDGEPKLSAFRRAIVTVTP
jgi:hypothetical protein